MNLALGLLGFVLVSWPLSAGAATDPAIAEHLEHAERVLRERDTSHLSAELRAARLANLDRLREYRLGGELPRNLDFPGARVPYFIDDRGVPCAMAYLVIASGHAGAAYAIAARENNALLLDMKSPELGRWLAQSGLTAQEAAFVQPTYDFLCRQCIETPPKIVCGTDGRTYDNPCWAELAQTEIERDGVCNSGDEVYVATCNTSGVEEFIPRGGCSVLGAAGAPGAGLVLLALLALCRRRR